MSQRIELRTICRALDLNIFYLRLDAFLVGGTSRQFLALATITVSRD